MGWEPTPWAVTNGQASAEIARVLAHVAFSGAAGIVASADLQVKQLSTPGASVRVLPGAAAIPCRAASQPYQSYAGRMPTEDVVGVAGTGGAARYDMVVARVEDPWLAGEPWADPPVGQELTGPYIFTRVISGVGQANIASFEAATAYLQTQAMSAIPLAGISLPTNTTSVTDAMITDLRRVANPRKDRRLYSLNPTGSTALSSATMANWVGSWSVSVPSWATRVIAHATVGGVRHTRLNSTTDGLASGGMRLALGSVVTQQTAYNFETSMNNAVARYTLVSGDTVSVPSNIRGTTQTLTIQASRTGGNVSPTADASSFVIVDIEFQEVAV